MHPRDQKQNRMFPVRISRVLKGTTHLKPALNILPGGSDSKASAYDAGDLGSIPGWGPIKHSYHPDASVNVLFLARSVQTSTFISEFSLHFEVPAKKKSHD